MKRSTNHRDRARSTPRSSAFFEPLERRQLMSGAGELDPMFSGDGKQTLALPGFNVSTSDVAVQKDGKTVVAGTAHSPTNGKSYFVVARYNLNGSPDASFGSSGNGTVRITGLGSTDNAYARAVAIQADGKIVVAGEAVVDTATTFKHDEMAIVRLLPNGSLDTTFDGDGKKTTRVGFDARAFDVAIQPDGKIVLAGTSSEIESNPFDFTAVRLNPNGSRDTTFGSAIPGGGTLRMGAIRIGLGGRDEAYGVAIDTNGNATTNPHFGKITLVGRKNYEHIGIVRLTPSGQRDSSFDSDGALTFRPPGTSSIGYTWGDDVLIQPGGKIVVAGRYSRSVSATAADSQFLLARFDPKGKLDTSFGGAGTGLVETGFGSHDVAHAIVRAPNGQLLAAGVSGRKLALAAYSANGVLDTTFGSNGRVGIDFGPGVSNDVGMALRADGRIVIAGATNFATAQMFLSRPRVEIQSHYHKAYEAGLQKGTAIITRNDARLPLRVYLSVGGTATLNGDYTTNLTIFEPPGSSGGTSSSFTKVGNLGGITNVIGGGGSIGGLGQIVSNRSLPFIDLASGQTSATVNVNVIQDSRLEPVETVIFTLAADSEYSIGDKKAATVFIEDDDDVRINFQTPATVPTGGYVADTGLTFGNRGNGLIYGWDADNTANARLQSDPGSPDFRYDTYNHMQKNGADRKWEIAVPNGLYQVRLVAGDPKHADSVYRMNLENTLALSGTPANDVRWFRRTINVQVNDGRLTLSNASGAVNNKIAFIDIQAAPIGATAGAVTANLPVRLVSPATMSMWTPKGGGIFGDKQIDEPLWA